LDKGNILRELEITKILFMVKGEEGREKGRRVKPHLRIMGAWVLPFPLYPSLFPRKMVHSKFHSPLATEDNYD
jgi:hypothetical protein